MLTPTFSITQDSNYLTITIEAKFANVAETEIEYSELDFVFSSSPYFLRLHLPSRVIDNETGTAKYDSDNGAFTVTVPKARKGEYFEGLDMITQLLRPQQKGTARAMVEEIEGEGEREEGEEEEEEDELDTVGNELLVDQSQHEGKEESVVDEESREYGYGFGWRRRGVLLRLKDEIGKLIDLEDAENTKIEERKIMSALRDRRNFNGEHYVADTFDSDEMLEEILKWKMDERSEITQEDRERLKDLPNKKLPVLSSDDLYAVSLSLLDILFSCAYDQRINMGDISVESSWTFIRLSPSLSSLTRWRNGKEAVQAAARRAVTYPLYRTWNLVEKVMEDLKEIIKRGRPSIVHALCTIHSQLAVGGDFRYLLNELILTDLLLWVQSVDKSVLERLEKELEEIELSKSGTGLDLERLEMEAKMSMMRMDGGDGVIDSDDE
ncbi:hypothetical protein PFISCL1PPCAC_15383 [Pristionchus fissidentatus]|uniref:Protein SHQ1 homolog n=1 Tax=Pristionchus fissidentatus TaxID=1538716 RepID=A0AAV5VX22_9BILA|nr:hypothetical protein PFISCL1PPCAC_15383 [Pristionchus fissidentatus]